MQISDEVRGLCNEIIKQAYTQQQKDSGGSVEIPPEMESFDSGKVIKDCVVGSIDDDILEDNPDACFDDYEEDFDSEEVAKTIEEADPRSFFRVVRGGRETAYATNKEDLRIVQPNEVKSMLKNDLSTQAQKYLNHAGFKMASENEMTQKIGKDIGDSYDKVIDKAQGIFYSRGMFNICGQSKEVKRAVVPLNLNNYRDSFRDGDIAHNYKSLCDVVTLEVLKNFPNIFSIAVSEYTLIINNLCFTPDIATDGLSFPLDCDMYIRNGCLAPFFDWSTLEKSYGNQVTVLSFDDYNFFTQFVANSFRRLNQIGVSTLFKRIPSLNDLYIGNEHTTRESLYTKDSSLMKEKVAKSNRFKNITNGYHLDVYKGTNGIQSFFVNSLVNYATNRGNRGFLRYCIGTTARVFGAVSGIALNASTHLIGGIVKVVKSSVTPVSQDELTS